MGAHHWLESGDLFANRYRIERTVGGGGMGTVYLAHDEQDGTVCALKLMQETDSDEQSRLRFEREAEVLAKLSHPGIVRYFGHGYGPEGTPYLAMEWLDGEDLAQRLRRQSLSVSESVSLVAAALDALAHAHRAGVIHRDIKPANLFLMGGAKGALKLIDFGVARLAGGSGRTRTGAVLGTPAYMSPEQIRGLRELDGRADLFSIGSVLFECLYGQTPFHSDQPMGVLGKILFEPAPDLRQLRPDLPTALCDLVQSLLAKDSAQRVGDAELAATRLRNCTLSAESVFPLVTNTPQALTHRELRWLSLVVVRPQPQRMELEQTLGPADQNRTLTLPMVQVTESFAAKLEPLPDGSTLVLLEGTESAAEQAETAALCARRLREQHATAPIAICLGQSDLSHSRLDAVALEHAAEMLAKWEASHASDPSGPQVAPILVDETVRRMLSSRFEFAEEDGLLLLKQEVHRFEPRVLGKVSPFAGRETELSQLHIALSSCMDNSAVSAMLITADPGMGKSRLWHEFHHQAKLRVPDLEVWIGSGDPSSAGSPFAMVAQAIRRAAAICDDVPMAVQREQLRTWLRTQTTEQDRTRIGECIGELIGVDYSDSVSPSLLAARDNPLVMGDQLRLAFCDLLTQACARHPLLFVLEDLHWGDYPTVQLFEAAMRSAQDLPLMVLALARPHIHDQFPKLWESRGLVRMPLRLLPKKASEKIVRSLLPTKLPSEQIAELIDRAAGNPFFLEELVRATSEGPLSELPESVLSMVQSRLLRLDALSRRVLRAASIFGRVFFRGGLVRLLGFTETHGHSHSQPHRGEEESLARALRVLQDRELISQRRPSRFQREEEYLFGHALIQESAYSMLTSEDRVLGHRLAAEYLLTAGENDALVLAEHFASGGAKEQAVQFYRQVVSEDLAGNDFQAALRHIERAVQLDAQGPALGALLAMQAEAHLWLAAYQPAIERAEEAMQLVPPGSPDWYRAVDAISISAARLLRHDRLLALSKQLFALLAPPDDAPALAIPLFVTSSVRLSMQLFIAGQYDGAIPLLHKIEEIVAQAPAPHPPTMMAQVLAMRANRAAVEWKLDISRDLYEQSAELLDQVGDVRGACSQRLDAALFCSDIADFSRMEHLLRKIVPVAESLGLLRLLGVARSALSTAMWRQGRAEEALPLCLTALQELIVAGDSRQQGVCRINIARIQLTRGELDLAQQAATEAAESLSVIPRFRLRALSLQAQIALAQGNIALAEAASTESMAVLTKLGRAGTDEALVRLNYAKTQLLLGRTEVAAEVLAQGRQRLQDRARIISSPAIRDDFLYKLSENAELLALAAQLCPEPSGS